MYFVFDVKTKQEQMATFAWLTRRGYIECVSNLGNSSHVLYDYVCIDVQAKEFGYFHGAFNNPRNVSFVSPKNFTHLTKEVDLAELGRLVSFTYTTNVTP